MQTAQRPLNPSDLTAASMSYPNESLDPELQDDLPPAAQRAGNLPDWRLLLLQTLYGLPWILLSTALLGALGFWLTQQIQPQYEARTVLIRHNKNTSVNPDIYYEPSLRTMLETVKVRENLTWLKQDLKLEATEEALFKQIDLRPGNRNDVIQLLATASDPQMAARMANRMAEIFQVSSAGVSRSVAERVFRFRQQQHDALQKKMQVAQNQLAAFQAQHKVAFFTEQTRLVMEQIKQLELDASRAQLQVQQDSLQLQSIAQELASRPEDIRVTSTVRHRTRVRIEDLRTELRGLQERYTEQNPKVLAIQQQIQVLEDSLKADTPLIPEEESFAMDPVVKELKIRQAELSSGLSGSQQGMGALQEQIKKQQEKLKQYALLEQDFNHLQREIEIITDNLRENAFRLAEAENAMQGNISSFDILERASVPVEPLPTRRKLLLLAALAAGLGLGLAGVWLRTLLEPRLLSPQQLTALQWPCLGVFVRTPAKAQGQAMQTQLLSLQHFLSKFDALPPVQGPVLLLVASEADWTLPQSFAALLRQTLEARGKHLVLVSQPQSAEPLTGQESLNLWLHQSAAPLPVPMTLNSHVLRYTYTPGAGDLVLPERLQALKQQHSQADLILWHLPVLAEQLPLMLSLGAGSDLMLLETRFKQTPRAFLKALRQALQQLAADLPVYSLLQDLPWRYRYLKP